LRQNLTVLGSCPIFAMRGSNDAEENSLERPPRRLIDRDVCVAVVTFERSRPGSPTGMTA
jgi:hypothetical protein